MDKFPNFSYVINVKPSLTFVNVTLLNNFLLDECFRQIQCWITFSPYTFHAFMDRIINNIWLTQNLVWILRTKRILIQQLLSSLLLVKIYTRSNLVPFLYVYIYLVKEIQIFAVWKCSIWNYYQNLAIMYWILLMWQLLGTDKFAKVIDFLRRQLHRETVVDDLQCVFLVFVLMSRLHSINILCFFSFIFCSLSMSIAHFRQTQMNW